MQGPLESRDFDLKLLKLFELLYLTKSVSRSAERLGLSQPSVSIWLGKLREQFNDPLFVRTSEGMQPTPRAENLMPLVQSAIESIRQLSNPEPDFDPLKAQRTFRICMTDASHITLLPVLLNHLQKNAPGIHLEAAQINDGMSNALQSGGADLAIGLLPQLETGFYQQTLFTQDWVCLANKNHPRIQKKITLQKYKDESHISIASGTGYMLLTEALTKNKIERNVGLVLPGFLGLPAIISTTDLIATLPRQIGETLASTHGLQALDCPIPIATFSVKQHWHARFHYDSANKWLRNTCKAILGI